MKKVYLLVFSLLLFGLAIVRAQDSSGCNGAFTAIPAGFQVYFWAADSLPGVIHRWNFGDSTQRSTDSSLIVHVYSHPGNFLVTQVVIDSVHHCQNSSSQLITIQANPGPTCSLSITVSSDSAHRLYSFVANPVIASGAVDTVTWTINDTLAGHGDTLTKTLAIGNYNVCAMLSTSDGCQVQSCVPVDVSDSVPPPPPPPDTCTIAFTAVPKDHKPNQYVFTVVDGKEYDSISWTIMGPDSLFAGPYHGPSFSYTFPDTGYYAVYVTAEKRSGCLVSNGQYVQIDSVPGPHGHSINSYPNPATTQVTLNVTLDEYTTIDILVYNSMGGQVLSRSVSGYPGANQITLPIANLPIGVYYIQLQYDNTILKSKIQKL
ncbi:MAG TPA: PKD domain-containing protein [Puia sp.]|jgi:hypothetical protein|nr:PKD domain-containing protein [Puia sp.]